MCDIIHKRMHIFFYRFDMFFNLTKLKVKHDKLLKTIHNLTEKVFRYKKNLYMKELENGNNSSNKKNSVETDLHEHSLKHSSDSIELNRTKGLWDDLDVQDNNDIGEKIRPAFLDLMIETSFAGGDLSDEEIKEEVNTIMFEGHDTTAVGSSFVLCLLGLYQDVQEKVWQEQYHIFGNSDREATFSDTIEMNYLERVILETLRLYPPVPIIARKINEDVKLGKIC